MTICILSIKMSSGILKPKDQELDQAGIILLTLFLELLYQILQCVCHRKMNVQRPVPTDEGCP